MKKIQVKLESLGIQLNPEAISVVVAAYEAYVKNTMDGKKHIVEMFGFDWTVGDSEYVYELLDSESLEKVKAEDIIFLNTVVSRGSFHSPKAVRARPLEKDICTCCGVVSHCQKKVGDQTWCNSCLAKDEFLKGEADATLCRSCTKTSCRNHPDRVA